MSWRDRLQPASWRGVPFFVQGHTHSGGHRLNKHQFANRPGQYAEEVGVAAEGYSVTAFVLGPDYDRARDALTTELRKTGAGELVHPYLGRIRCKLERWQLSESSEDGGVARFSLNFVQSDDQLYPLAGTDQQSKVLESIDGLKNAALERFEELFNVGGFSDFVTTTAASKLSAVAETIESTTSFFFGASETVADLAVQLASLKNDAATLVTSPAQAGGAVQTALGLLATAADTDKAMFSMFGFGSDDEAVPTTTPARIQQAANQKAVNDIVRATAIAEAGERAVGISFETYNDAVAYRTELLAAIDTRMEEDIAPAEFDALASMRTNIAKAIPAEDDLPRLRTYQPVQNEPSLVASHRLYGNTRMAEDIVGRNDVRHPGFLPAGEELQVLTND